MVLVSGSVNRVECFRRWQCGTFLAVRLVPKTRVGNHQMGQKRQNQLLRPKHRNRAA